MKDYDVFKMADPSSWTP